LAIWPTDFTVLVSYVTGRIKRALRVWNGLECVNYLTA